jgi:TolA-binding protein
MTREPSFEHLRAEQDELRAQASFLARAQAKRGSTRRGPRARAKRRVGWLLASVACAAAALALWLAWPRATPALTFTVGEDRHAQAGSFVAAPADRELPLHFADGTRFFLAAGTSARVVSLDERGAHLVLEKGRAVADVVHGPDSRWRVDVGPFQVAVVGTRFDVSWDAAARVLELKLEQGAVLVSGGLFGEALEVRAGQRLRAFADHARVELSGAEEAQRTPPDEDVTDGASPKPAPSADTTRGRPSATTPSPASSLGPPAWRALAATGKFRQALAAAEQAGFEAECRRSSGTDLLMLADAARLSGAAERAEQAYEAARRKLPGGGRASYGLGLVAFDQRGDFSRAARYFEAYLHGQPAGPLRAEATGRLMESWQRAGRVSEARQVAAQYLARYPQGPQAARARQLLQ